MSKSKWAILAGAITAGIVLLAALGYGVHELAAQEQPAATPTTVPAQEQQPAATPTTVPAQGQGECCPCGVGLGEAARWGWRMYGQADIIAETLGMTTTNLLDTLRSGKSVADIAAEKGVALDTIVQALMAPRREALATAVSEGKLTQQQADEMLTNMQENITKRLQEPETFGIGPGMGPAGQVWRAERWGWQMHGQADIIAETLGMTTTNLLDTLRSGKSVADIAAEKGVALDTIVQALMAPRREALATAVSEGKLTQQQADEMLTNMQESITKQLQQPWPNKGMGLGGGMGGGWMRHGGGWGGRP